MIETKRLRLREYTMEDFDALREILSDPVTMAHYPEPYDDAGVMRWINWNLQNYKDYGFGLWAMELKETGEFIGDCGITMQNIDGVQLPEIGYHVHKNHWRKGYGSETAKTVRDWAFANRDFERLYSYMTQSNIASWSTAAAAGMHRVKEYTDERYEEMYVYAISREEWLRQSNK